MKKFLLLMSIVAALSVPGQAQILVDVQFGGNDFYGSDSADQTGAGIVGGSGDIWNHLNYGGALPSGVALNGVTGASSGITLTGVIDSGSFSEFSFGPGSSSPPFQSTSLANLYQGVLNAGGTGTPNVGSTFTFSGLTVGQTYNLYVYSAFNNNTRESQWSVNGGTTFDIGPNGSTTVVSSPQNYILLTGTADLSGDLTVRADPVSGELDVNGFQLQPQVVPEPSVYAMLIAGFAALFLVQKFRRRVV